MKGGNLDMWNNPDLAIIGSGSGNSLITPYWDDKRVTLVEAHRPFGGTCLNVGCIPTKMFVRTAETARTSSDSERLNVSMHTDAVDWEGVRDRIFGRIDPLAQSGRKYRGQDNANVELVEQHATLTGGTSFTTPDDQKFQPQQLVIAAGSRPFLPDIAGIELPNVHTSDTIMRLPEQPESLIIVGGGDVACEFASIFSGLGTNVTQVIRGRRLLKHLDDEISEAFTEEARTNWKLITEQSPLEIQERDGCASVLFAHSTDSNSEVSRVCADTVLIATGRVPNTDSLGARAAGFDLHDDGRLKVDEYMRVLAQGTAVSGVYALGDVCSSEQLKHVANHQARIVSHNLEHPDDLRVDGLLPVVAATFTHPEVASVGLTEHAAIEEIGSENVTVNTQMYSDVAYGWALEDRTGRCKVVADTRTGQILGASVMGYQASNIIQPIVMAMSFDVDAYTVARGQYWPHPALSEVVENALLGLNVPEGDTF